MSNFGNIRVGSISDSSGNDAPVAGAGGKLGKIALDSQIKTLEQTILNIQEQIKSIVAYSQLDTVLSIKTELKNDYGNLTDSINIIKQNYENIMVQYSLLSENIDTNNSEIGMKLSEFWTKIVSLTESIDNVYKLSKTYISKDGDEHINGEKTFFGNVVIKGRLITEEKSTPHCVYFSPNATRHTLTLDDNNKIKIQNSLEIVSDEKSVSIVSDKTVNISSNCGVIINGPEYESLLNIDRNQDIPSTAKTIIYTGGGSHTLILPLANSKPGMSQRITIINKSSLPIVISVNINNTLNTNGLVNGNAVRQYISDGESSWMEL